jgi:hypothetical protein
MSTEQTKNEDFDTLWDAVIEELEPFNVTPQVMNRLYTLTRRDRDAKAREVVEELCRNCTKRFPEYGKATPIYADDIKAIALSHNIDLSARDCEHHWIDATNERVEGTAYCKLCGKLAKLSDVIINP